MAMDRMIAHLLNASRMIGEKGKWLYFRGYGKRAPKLQVIDDQKTAFR
jgi:hypothetical protein